MTGDGAHELSVAVIGASGKTGWLITERFLEAGHDVRAISRNRPKKSPSSAMESFSYVAGDVTVDDPTPWMTGIDVVIFAAGGSSATEEAVDHLGAARCAEAARSAGVQRFILISAHGAHDPASWGREFQRYLEVKAAGEVGVQSAFPGAIILRPGILTDEPATGCGTIRRTTGPGHLPISRADVAAAVLACSNSDRMGGIILEIVGGETALKGFFLDFE